MIAPAGGWYSCVSLLKKPFAWLCSFFKTSGATLIKVELSTEGGTTSRYFFETSLTELFESFKPLTFCFSPSSCFGASLVGSKTRSEIFKLTAEICP